MRFTLSVGKGRARRSLAFGVVLILACLLAQPVAALTDRWAAWAPITGVSNDYSTTMTQRSTGFPVATMASDSKSNVQLPSGASAFLGAGTPPGAKYGSSINQSYAVLRAKADTATTPSTTTYTFENPTPDTGWAFVLGDIDADQVQVRATNEAGDAVPASQIDSWFQDAFNYAGEVAVPTWQSGTSTLTGSPGALDTNGASGWFEPDIRLTSLSFVFTRLSGFPVYQTWFVSRARPIGGVVTDTSAVGSSCPVEDATMTLVSPYGEELATTSPDATGAYDFGEFATQAGYVVRLDVPTSCSILGAAEQTVSNSGNDGDPASRADFDVRAIVPQPISGTVRDDGNPVAGVEVTLTRPGGGTVTTTTAGDGTYLFDDNALGTGYSVSIDVPGGYAAGPDGTEIDGINIATSPVANQDFVVVQLASVSGTVTGGGNGLGGVQVVLTPDGGGPPITTVTSGDGTYDLSGVPPGDYTLTIDPPPGYSGDTSRPVTVAGADLTGEDFALLRPGALGGQVTQVDDGSPVGGVSVVVDGPGGVRTITTTTDGTYFLDGLAPGTYTISITAPDGSTVSGPGTLTVTITAAGEIRGGQDFLLDDASQPPGPTDSPSPSGPPTDGPTGGPGPTGPPGDTDPGTGLPDTGGPSVVWALLGVGLLLSGVTLLITSRRRDPSPEELSGS